MTFHVNQASLILLAGFIIPEPHDVERWGAGVETQKMYGERLGDGVEYHLMSPTPRR